jgi:multicomponent Na+:H+ antiporter subunit G
MTEIVISGFVILGSFYMLIAALGIVKLKDVYMRMHAITKASSLSVLLLIVAVMVAFPSASTIISGLSILLFIILTAPIASHMMARVAHLLGIKPAPGCVSDELEEDEKN